MTTTSISQLDLVESTPASQLDPQAKQTKAALKHCNTAWRRAYKAALKRTEGDDIEKAFATGVAGEAYCFAMPLLSGYQGIRDFIACTANGMLIGAIPAKKGGQFLHAAELALAALNRESK